MPRCWHSSTSYLGSSNSYFTNSRLARSAKSLIGNTPRKTSCRPDWVRLAAAMLRCRKFSYELFWTSMRLGIGATDSMWPKKRRIRLRVLKAVAILRPRRFKGGRNTRCFLGAPGPPAVRPIRRRGPLVGTDFLEVCSDKGPSLIFKLPLPPRGGRGNPNSCLLQLDLGALGLELGLELLGVGLRHAFLDRLGRALDQVLGLLEAETGDLAHRLDDVDLLVAGGGEDDVELVLDLGRSGSSSARRGSGGDRSGGADAPLLLKQLAELSGLEDRQGRELLDQLFQISHFSSPEFPNFVETDVDT